MDIVVYEVAKHSSRTEVELMLYRLFALTLLILLPSAALGIPLPEEEGIFKTTVQYQFALFQVKWTTGQETAQAQGNFDFRIHGTGPTGTFCQEAKLISGKAQATLGPIKSECTGEVFYLGDCIYQGNLDLKSWGFKIPYKWPNTARNDFQWEGSLVFRPKYDSKASARMAPIVGWDVLFSGKLTVKDPLEGDLIKNFTGLPWKSDRRKISFDCGVGAVDTTMLSEGFYWTERNVQCGFAAFKLAGNPKSLLGDFDLCVAGNGPLGQVFSQSNASGEVRIKIRGDVYLNGVKVFQGSQEFMNWGFKIPWSLRQGSAGVSGELFFKPQTDFSGGLEPGKRIIGWKTYFSGTICGNLRPPGGKNSQQVKDVPVDKNGVFTTALGKLQMKVNIPKSELEWPWPKGLLR